VKENYVFDSLIYLEPVKRFENRSNVMKFRSFGDSTTGVVSTLMIRGVMCDLSILNYYYYY